MQPSPNEEQPVNAAPATNPPQVIAPDMTPQVSEPMWQPETPAVNNHSEPTASTTEGTATSLVPQPVVNVLSPRGVEYVFLTIALFTAAIGLAGALIAAVNGALSFSSLSFPVALLLVGLPIFTWLFLRVKKAELVDPSAALDASKRRSTQATQIICFLVVLFTLTGFITAVMAKIGGQLGESLVKVVLDVLVLLVVFGGILAYYWRDEHKA